jgi:hypothetical protein
VATPIVALSHDVEEEGFDVIVEGLVVQEELGHQAEVLAVDLVLLAVHLWHIGLSKSEAQGYGH